MLIIIFEHRTLLMSLARSCHFILFKNVSCGRTFLGRVYSRDALAQRFFRVWFPCALSILLQESVHPSPVSSKVVAPSPILLIFEGVSSFQPTLYSIQTERNIQNSILQKLWQSISLAEVVYLSDLNELLYPEDGQSYWPNSGHMLLEDKDTSL